MKRFEEMDYQDAVGLIELKKQERGVADGYEVRRKMAEAGDFWQDGELWKGPRGSDVAWAERVKAAVARQHVGGGAILEGLANFVRGLLGKQANIQAVPAAPVVEGSEAEKTLAAEAEALIDQLSTWWDRVGLWADMRQTVVRSRWAGWGAMRLRVPKGRLGQDKEGNPTLPSFATFEEALAAIELDAPEPEHCVVVEHPDTQQRGAVFHFTGKDEAGRDLNYVELWYDEGEGNAKRTILRRLPQNGTPEGPFSYEWGGRLPVAEMDGGTLLTQPVIDAEAALAFALTNTVRVGETAGFRAHITTNAEEPGFWSHIPPDGGAVPVTDTETDGEGRTLYKHPLPWSLGAGVTANVIGITARTDDKGEAIATPGVHTVDPVDPDYATKGADFWRRRILELCYQGHLARTGGEASGLAYEQARAAFAGDLQLHVDPAERVLTQILEAAITMAESMMRNPPRILERLRLIVTLTPDPGPASPEFRAQVISEVNAGLRSRSSAMALLGIDDVGAELDAIAQDPLSQLSITERRAKVMAALPDEVPLVTRAILVGYTEEEARQYFGEADAARVRAEEQARDEIRDALERGTGEGAAA